MNVTINVVKYGGYLLCFSAFTVKNRRGSCVKIIFRDFRKLELFLFCISPRQCEDYHKILMIKEKTL